IHLTGDPTAFWPPGYPLLLAAAYTVFGQSIAVAQALNVVLATATVGLVYLIGRETLGARPALVAAAVVAAFPSLVFFTAVTLSETAFAFLALSAVYLLVLEAKAPTTGAGQRASRSSARTLRLLFAAGLILGLASLTRGQALLLPLVAVPFWLRSGAGWPRVGANVAVLVLGIALIVVPWTVRNAIELDSPVLISTNAGVDFWIGHHEGAVGDFGATGGDELVFSHPELSGVEREVQVNLDGLREGLEYAVTHPLQELALPFQKLFWLYYNDEEGLKWNDGHRGQPFMAQGLRNALLGLSNVYYVALLTFVALGVRLWFSVREPGRVLLVSLVAYWTLVHLVFFGDPRFHAPIMPVAALLAAPALVALWSGRRPWAKHP
ncbi:MAG: glycosyltransferase family 39 protein, partial [Dehalococcoidia bacterium]